MVMIRFERMYNWTMILFETITGIHRNYHKSTRYRKMYIIVTVSIELLLSACYFFSNVAIGVQRNHNLVPVLLFATSKLLNYTGCLLFPIKYSKIYRKLNSTLRTLTKSYKSINVHKNVSIYFMALAGVSILSAAFTESGYESGNFKFAYECYSRLYGVVFELRFYLHLCRYVTITAKVVQIINCLNTSINYVVEEVDYKFQTKVFVILEDLTGIGKVWRYRDDIELWKQQYSMLVTCSAITNECFKIQVLIHFIEL
jgi:Na+-transporting NADH:ubiquinone oxidoreductase subunit NqrE